METTILTHTRIEDTDRVLARFGILVCFLSAFSVGQTCAQPPSTQTIVLMQTADTPPGFAQALEDELLTPVRVVDSGSGREPRTFPALAPGVWIMVRPGRVVVAYAGDTLFVRFDSATTLSILAARTAGLMDDFGIPRVSSALAAESAERSGPGDLDPEPEAAEPEAAEPEAAEPEAVEPPQTRSGALSVGSRDGLLVGAELHAGIGVGARLAVGAWLSPRVRLAGVVAVLLPYKPNLAAAAGAELGWVQERRRRRVEAGGSAMAGLADHPAALRGLQVQAWVGAFLGLGRQVSDHVALVGRVRAEWFWERDLESAQRFFGAHLSLGLGVEWSR